VSSERPLRLSAASYELLVREARRRGVEPDALADEIVRTNLSAASGDLASALSALAQFRATLPEIDGLALARESRDELHERGA